MIFYLPGNLPFFALDYMPMPSTPIRPVVYNGYPHYNLIDYRYLPTSKFEKGYVDGLRQGYSFVGALPASLSVSSRAGLDCEAIGLFEPLYLIARLLVVLGIVAALLTAFAVQARWLGAIPALERARPTEAVTPLEPTPTEPRPDPSP